MQGIPRCVQNRSAGGFQNKQPKTCPFVQLARLASSLVAQTATTITISDQQSSGMCSGLCLRWKWLIKKVPLYKSMHHYGHNSMSGIRYSLHFVCIPWCSHACCYQSNAGLHAMPTSDRASEVIRQVWCCQCLVQASQQVNTCIVSVPLHYSHEQAFIKHSFAWLYWLVHTSFMSSLLDSSRQQLTCTPHWS